MSPIFKPHGRVDQALNAVVTDAYIGGISTRKVEAPVAALGVQTGISKSQASRICANIGILVQALLKRPLHEGGYTYALLNPNYFAWC